MVKIRAFFDVAGLKGRILSAQAKGLGMNSQPVAGLKGSFIANRHHERPLQGQYLSSLHSPGLRPGLTEPTFQAGNPVDLKIPST